MSQLTELLDVNLNETEGMPEKARKGYAALSILRGSKLENIHIRKMLNCGFLNVCRYLQIDSAVNIFQHQLHTLTCLFPSCFFQIERRESVRMSGLESSPKGWTIIHVS